MKARAEAVATVAAAASVKITVLLNTPPLCDRTKIRKSRGPILAGGGAGSPILMAARAEATATVAAAAGVKVAALLNTPPLCKRKNIRKSKVAIIVGAGGKARAEAKATVAAAAIVKVASFVE
jgi:energy-converting hydrogenase Eha subunit A